MSSDTGILCEWFEITRSKTKNRSAANHGIKFDLELCEFIFRVGLFYKIDLDMEGFIKKNYLRKYKERLLKGCHKVDKSIYMKKN